MEVNYSLFYVGMESPVYFQRECDRLLEACPRDLRPPGERKSVARGGPAQDLIKHRPNAETHGAILCVNLKI